MPKVVGINGSANKKGNTFFLLNECIESAKENGMETELLQLAEFNVKPCDHCLECVKGKKCPIKDDFAKIEKKMIEADAIIFATPVYSAGISQAMKNIMERSYPLRLGGLKLKDKFASFICMGGLVHGFQELAALELNAFALYHGMLVFGNAAFEDPLKPYSMGPFVIGSQQRDDGLMHFVKKDNYAVEGAKALGKRAAELLKK
ncbi:MAG: flavodoxin family protein [Candidatus Diapherotrites archaeon]